MTIEHPPALLGKVRTLAVSTVENWVKHGASTRSASLAFYTLFSLAPLLVLIVSIAGLVIGGDAAQSEVFVAVRAALGTTFSNGIEQLLRGAITSGESTKANLLATAVLLIGSTSAFVELKGSLDAIWEQEATSGSGVLRYLRTRIVSVVLVVALAPVLVALLAISTALQAFDRFWTLHWPTTELVLRPAADAVVFLVVCALFSVVYKVLPERHLRWSDVLVGASSSAVLFTLGKALIGAYLSRGRLAPAYGAASSAVVLTSWVYYSALVFFLGAEFTRQYTRLFGSESHGAPRSPATDEGQPGLSMTDSKVWR